jgi:hypothetical protein
MYDHSLALFVVFPFFLSFLVRLWRCRCACVYVCVGGGGVEFDYFFLWQGCGARTDATQANVRLVTPMLPSCNRKLSSNG